MILTAKPLKPFSYTAKGIPTRQMIIQDYDETFRLYASIRDSTQPDIAPPTSWDTASRTRFVQAVIEKNLPQMVEDDADLFRHGWNSLQATWIRNSLLRGLRESINLDIRQNTKNFVYDYPTIVQLGKLLSSVARSGFPEVAKAADQKAVQAMHAMAEKYSSDFPKGQRRKTQGGGKVVMVTGTTGGFGSYLLARLVADEAVSIVYAVNRKNKKSSLEERQIQAFREKGIDERLLKSVKVKMVEADLLKKDFGMGSDEFEKMRHSVTHIIHNAWRVHFNAPLSEFEPNVQGLRALIDFSLTHGSRLIFIASVGVFQRIGHASILLERPVPADVAIGLGYAQSKWVAEEVLLNAIRAAGLNSLVVRVGQLCGSSTTGAWNINEWAPAMIQSANVLGCLPIVDGTISWIPSDLASQAILDLLDIEDTRAEPILHLRHPYPVEWNTLMNSLASQLKVTSVSYTEWLRRLEESSAKQLVATRLLPFFQNIPIRHDVNPVGLEAFAVPDMDITIARKMCKSFAGSGYPTLNAELARKWLRYWQTRGELVGTQRYVAKM
ncbi:hypothetical protein Moror_5196 [Moniliophthora roreri MCA 2997]|uniref:Thioester reductase (TE) domain-containing protein n=2 Tax=Moniliophthora roreri TaxID=221103 RepID=V2YBY9_MONRO|nr:hypothetical protein Moror_5196 [Moniliophthora roreri MCA 2997]KAI3610044.1 hypothetical protein WG66_007392 [Moniliophthora roreri]